MKKLIAFSLWGDNPKYCIGAIKNAHLTNEIYSGWTSRFYCGKSVPEDVLNQLREVDNCEVILMEEDGNWAGMFWRFLPASESDVEVMLSRDCDSRLNLREKSAVDEYCFYSCTICIVHLASKNKYVEFHFYYRFYIKEL